MFFRLPNPPLSFEIPDDWLIETGAMGFKRTFAFTWFNHLPSEEAVLVPIDHVAPTSRKLGVELDHNGFRKHAHAIEATRPGGMLGVLSAITKGTPLPALEVYRTRTTKEGLQFKIGNGFHRFYASHVLGFVCLPCVILHDFPGNEKFGDE